ncbi:hypothetical protein [Mesorhizobium sp.]|nr:hypothetical protein [Mesorhizobium sp.]
MFGCVPYRGYFSKKVCD